MRRKKTTANESRKYSIRFCYELSLAKADANSSYKVAEKPFELSVGSKNGLFYS